MTVVDAREKIARRREKAEHRWLYEVGALINHDASLRVQAGLTAAKTMHHGTDLCGVIAKSRHLQIKHSFHQDRFLFGRCESGAVLIVTMPSGYYCLCDWDDFVYPLAELPEKILETSPRLGIWESADE